MAKVKPVKIKTTEALAEALGFSPIDGVEIEFKSDVNYFLIQNS